MDQVKMVQKGGLAEVGRLEECGVPTLLAAVGNPVEDLISLGFTREKVCRVHATLAASSTHTHTHAHTHTHTHTLNYHP